MTVKTKTTGSTRNPDKTRLFSEEIAIADREYRKKNADAYRFDGGRRVFKDKVDSKGY